MNFRKTYGQLEKLIASFPAYLLKSIRCENITCLHQGGAFRTRIFIAGLFPPISVIRTGERCTDIREGDEEDHVPTRNSVLGKLSSYTLKENEWMLMERGFKTLGRPWRKASGFVPPITDTAS